MKAAGVQDVECGLGVEGRVRDKGAGEDLIEVQVQPLGFLSLRSVHICGSEDRTLNCQHPPGCLFVTMRVIATGLIETDL